MMPTANNDPYLMQALNFTESDLILNRSGQLALGQIAALEAVLSANRRFLKQVILFAIAIVVVVGFLLLTWQDIGDALQEALKTEYGWIPLAIPVGVFGFWVLMMLMTLLRRPRVRPDMPVRTVEGAAAVHEMLLPPESTANIIAQQVNGDVASFKLNIGRTEFFVVPLVARVFVPGQMYRAHYVQLGGGKRGRLLISAERL